MWFVKDLKEWEEYEHKVLEIIRSDFLWETWEKNQDKKWVDLISSNWTTIEVKYDRQAQSTWNVFIEVECNNSPSWIYKYDKIDYLAYTIPPYSYLVKVEELKELISLWDYRTVKWGDWWRSKGVLIPLEDYKTITIKTLKLWSI